MRRENKQSVLCLGDKSFESSSVISPRGRGLTPEKAVLTLHQNFMTFVLDPLSQHIRKNLDLDVIANSWADDLSGDDDEKEKFYKITSDCPARFIIDFKSFDNDSEKLAEILDGLKEILHRNRVFTLSCSKNFWQFSNSRSILRLAF